MAYRLPSERVPLEIEGPPVEVERLAAPAIYQAALRLMSVVMAGETDDGLANLYGYFLVEAQPTWAIVDHRGPIYPSVAGMLRLPTELGVGIVLAWLETHIPKASAADEILPPGAARDAVNAALKSKR